MVNQSQKLNDKSYNKKFNAKNLSSIRHSIKKKFKGRRPKKSIICLHF